MVVNFATRQYTSELAMRLQSTAFCYSIAQTPQGYLLASKQGDPFVGRVYNFVIAEVNGAQLAPRTLDKFIDDSYEFCFAQFKREFGFAKRSFKNLVLVPALVSDTPYAQDVLYRATNHENRQWNVSEIPVLVETNPLRLYYQKIRSRALQSAVNETLDLQALPEFQLLSDPLTRLPWKSYPIIAAALLGMGFASNYFDASYVRGGIWIHPLLDFLVIASASTLLARYYNNVK